MYLFIYGDYEEGSAFEIVGGYSFNSALENFYEQSIKLDGIDGQLLGEMIRNLSAEKAIQVFNALVPFRRIKAVYSGLTAFWREENA